MVKKCKNDISLDFFLIFIESSSLDVLFEKVFVGDVISMFVFSDFIC